MSLFRPSINMIYWFRVANIIKLRITLTRVFFWQSIKLLGNFFTSLICNSFWKMCWNWNRVLDVVLFVSSNFCYCDKSCSFQFMIECTLVSDFSCFRIFDVILLFVRNLFYVFTFYFIFWYLSTIFYLYHWIHGEIKILISYFLIIYIIFTDETFFKIVKPNKLLLHIVRSFLGYTCNVCMWKAFNIIYNIIFACRGKLLVCRVSFTRSFPQTWQRFPQ